MKNMTKKFLASALALATVFTSTFADVSIVKADELDGMAEVETYVSNATASQWEQIAFSEIKAEDTIAIAVTTDNGAGSTYVLSNIPNDLKSPNATALPASIDNGVLSVGGYTEDQYSWTISAMEEGKYSIKNGDSTFLSVYAGANSGRLDNEAKEWWMDASGYLACAGTDKNGECTRYLGVYTTKPDFRTYNSPTGANIKNQLTRFFKLTEVVVDVKGEKIAASDLADGTEFVLSVNGKIMSSVAGNKGFTAVDGTVTENVLTVADQATLDSLAVMTAHVTQNGYTFTNAAGAFLTSMPTGNGITFETEANEYSYWTLEQREDGVTVIVNNSAIYTKNGVDYNQALELNNDRIFTYNYLSSFTRVYPYAAEFFEVPEVAKTEGGSDAGTGSGSEDGKDDGKDEGEGEKEETPSVADGTYVIYNPSSKMAMSSTAAATNYRAGVEMTLNDKGAFDTVADTEKWTVKNNEDGTITISCTEGVLAVGETYSSANFDTTNPYKTWTLESAGNGLFYVKNATKPLKNDTAPFYLEWYASKSNFTTFATTKLGDAFAMQFVACEASSSSDDKKEDEVKNVADGTYVIYNPSSKMAMSSTAAATNYRAGVEMTLNDKGAFDTVADTEKWTVKNNEDGTVTISCSEGVLAVGETYSSANFDTTNPYKTWTLESAGNGLFYVKNATKPLKNDTAPFYLEWYASKSNFTTFATTKLGDAFAMQFVACEASSSEEEKKDEETVEKLADGTYYLYSAEAKGVLKYGITAGCAANVPATYDASTNTVAETTALKGAAVFNIKYVESKSAYEIKCGKQYLAANSKEELYLADASADSATACTYWVIEKVTKDGADLGYSMKSKSVKYNNGDVYVEYYSSKGFCLYTASKGLSSIYYFTFPTAASDSDEDGDGYAYATCPVAAALPKAGAKVVISNDANKQVISSMIQGTDGAESKMGAVDIKFNEDGSYVVDNGGLIFNLGIDESIDFSSAAKLKVTKTADGEYVFTCDGKYLTGSADGKSVSYEAEKTDYATWKLEENENGFYLICSKAVYTYKESTYDAAIEYFGGTFSLYELNRTNTKYSGDAYRMQFFDANGKLLSSVEDGAEVYIFNPANKTAVNATAKKNTSGISKLGSVAVGNTYYYFENNGTYLATNNNEELLVQEKLDDMAKWEIVPVVGGYLLKSKAAAWTSSSGNSYPIYIEYFSGAFAGYSYKATSSDIFTFNLYEVEDTYNTGYVINPNVKFNTEANANWDVDYTLNFTLNDLGTIKKCTSSVVFEDGTTKNYDVELKNYDGKITIPGADLTNHSEAVVTISATSQETETVVVDFSGTKKFAIDDLPVITSVSPAANSQTGDDKKPVITVGFANAKDDATYTIELNETKVDTKVDTKTKAFTYTPSADLEDGKYTVTATVTRADGKVATKTWSFTVGIAGVQPYFGQIHSHTAQYSDGSGTLNQAYEYAMNTAANCDYMIVTDHSNYFDSTTTAAASDYLDKAIYSDDAPSILPSKTEGLNLWQEAKATAKSYDEKSKDFVAGYGYEMTWSGGPGHINVFNTAGIVSRNNTTLNAKTNDAGMLKFYDVLVSAQDANAFSNEDSKSIVAQFNHPGTTFGYFDSFTGWTVERDDIMNLIEVGNGDGAIGGTAYFPSYEYYDMCLTVGWHVAPTNGQDNHKGSWGDSNTARTVVLTDDFTEAGVYNAMDSRHIYSTEDQNLVMYFNLDDKYMMGDIAEGYNSDKVNLTVSLSDNDREDLGYLYIIGIDGKVLYTSDYLSGNTADLTISLDNSSPYYYAKLVQKDKDIAVTSPIWVADVATPSNVVASITYTGESENPSLTEGTETTLTSTLTNGDEKALSVTSYTVKIGDKVVATETLSTPVAVAAGKAYNVDYKWTPDSYGKQTVTVSFTYKVGNDSFTKNATKNIRVNGKDYDKISTVADIKAAAAADKDKAGEGLEFTIEGVITANTSGYDKNTAFFDCTYIQDSTGGINVFPVSDSFQIGQKVRAHGAITYYNGEIELNVSSDFGGYVKVIEEGLTTVAPTKVSTADAMLESNIGLLMQVTGKVTRILEQNGVVERIYVRDKSGFDACVFINGYIWNSAKEDSTFGKDGKLPVVGDTITVVGIGSVDVDELGEVEFLHRLRVRDRAEITIAKKSSSNVNNGSANNGGSAAVTYPTTGNVGTTTSTEAAVTKNTKKNKTEKKTEEKTEEKSDEEAVEASEEEAVEEPADATIDADTVDVDDDANISDDEVPAAASNETGSMTWLWVIIAVLAVIAIAYVIYSSKKRKASR